MGRISSYPDGAGIYKLTCKISGKLYIGKTVNFRVRMSNHKSEKKDKHGHLQNAVRKYGWDSFDVEILEIFENFDKHNEDHRLSILQKEADYIKLYNSTNRDIGYNICEHSTDRTGIPVSAETKEKIRQYNLKNPNRCMLGKTPSDETKEKLRQANLGKTMSIESRMKLSQSKLGKPNNAYSNPANVGKMGMSGKKHSSESIEKMRQAQLGKPKTGKARKGYRKCSDEMKNKLRLTNTGQKRSEETKEKMRLAKLGKKRSEETLEKIRQTKLRNLNNEEMVEEIK